MTSAQPPPEIRSDRWRKQAVTVFEGIAVAADIATAAGLIDNATTFTVIAKVVALCGRTAAKLVERLDRD